MGCEDVDELLAAYGVSALVPDEEDQVREHLASCDRHAQALAEMRAVVDRLPLAAEEREPPAALQRRLLDAFDREVDAARASEPRPRRLWPRRWRAPGGVLAYAAAAALLVIAIGLGAWNVTLQFGRDDEDSTFVTTFAGEAGDGTVVHLRDEGLVLIDVRLPEPGPDRTYQAWNVGAAGAVSLGLVPDDGTVSFQGDFADTDAIAISEEPAGGSEQPTTDPLLVASLR